MGTFDDSSSTSDRRLTRIALVLLGCVTVGSLFWLVHPYFAASNDASIYIQSARSMLRGEGYSYMGDPVIVRPPGLPVLIAPVIALAGVDFRVLNLYVSLLGVVCVVLCFFYSRPRLGVPLSLLVALGVWFNPGFTDLRQRALSDVPGAAFLLGCLLLERWARARPSPRRDLLLGVTIGLGCYVRTALVFLVPAILASRALEWLFQGKDRPGLSSFVKRHALTVAIVPVLVLLPWNVRNRIVEVPTPTEHLAVHSYSVAMWHADLGDPESPLVSWQDMKTRVTRRVDDVLSSLGNRLKGRWWKTDTFVVTALAMVSWLIVLMRRREPAELFFGALLLVLATYFGFVIRLVLPLYILAFVNVADVLFLLLRRVAGSVAAQALIGIGIVGLGVADFDRQAAARVAQAHARLAAAADHVKHNFPPETVVGASNGRHLSVLLDRPVYTLVHAYGRDGADRVLQIVDEHGIRVVVLNHRRFTAELEQLLEPRTTDVRRVRGSTVVTLGPAADQSPD